MTPAEAEFGCPYRPAYANRCNAPKGESGFCRHHDGVKCAVCGEQATYECSYSGQFVCGSPLCPRCGGFVDTSKPSGAWGFMNHSHRQIMSAQKPRTMLPEDIGL